MRGVSQILALCATLTALPLQNSDALSSDQVFQKVSPCIVSFSDLEGGGSGVVLSSDGLILTNHHVVNTPLPIQVTATVKLASGEIATRVFGDIKIFKVHPKYDLALVKIEAKGVQFAAAKLRPKAQQIPTGAKCFVIGNPDGGETGVLEQSITGGLVSAASRTLDGLEYIQIGAAINPGNSGGAVCDENGQVFGIVTFKLEGVEGVGFAIPTRKLSMDEFGDPDKREGDLAKAIELQKIGNDYMTRAQLVANAGNREFLNHVGLIFHRMALAEYQRDASLFHNVGIAYIRLGQPEIAEPYFAEAVKVSSNFAPSRRNLGAIEFKRGQIDAAVAHWKAGSLDSSESNREQVAACLSSLAKLHFNKGEFFLAAYFIKWANSVSPPAGEGALSRRQVERGAFAKLTQSQSQMLTAKTAGFSYKDLDAIAEKEGDPSLPSGSPPPITSEGGSLNGIVTAILKSPAKGGDSITHEVSAAQGLELKLEDAPEGMSISGNKITWQVPPGFSAPHAEVLLSYQNNGVTSYRIEKIPVK